MVAALIRESRPNGHLIRFIKDCVDGYSATFGVQELDAEGYYEDGDWFGTQEEAETLFEARCKELLNTPDWEAQARYDELHGTDNGYSPWDVPREY